MNDISKIPRGRKLSAEDQKEFERRAHSVDGKECPTRDYSKNNKHHDTDE